MEKEEGARARRAWGAGWLGTGAGEVGVLGGSLLFCLPQGLPVASSQLFPSVTLPPEHSCSESAPGYPAYP